MNEQFESESNESSRENAKFRSSARPQMNGHSPHQQNGHAPSLFDAWTIMDMMAQRWHWLVVGVILGGAAMFVLGWLVAIKPKFTATVQLLRYETPATGDSLKGTPISPETFASLIVSPDLLRKIGERSDPPIPPERLIKQIKVDPQPDSDIVKVYFAAADPQQAVTLADRYSEEVVEFTSDLQARQAAQVASNYLQRQVEDMDKDITALHEQFRALPLSGPVTNKLHQVSGELNALSQNLSESPRSSVLTMKLSEKLQTSIAELSDLTSKYTDLHPFVQEKEAQIASLKQQLATAATNSGGLSMMGATGLGGTGFDPNIEIIQAKLRSLEDARIAMANREREAELFASNPPGVVRVFSPASLKTVQSNHRRIKIGLATIFGGVLGFGCSLLMILLAEAFDSRLRTVEDLKRVTHLPVLTTLGNLNRMPETSQTQWAFRTWTMLQGRLSRSPHHGLVCGVTSSSEGEGRSTWIRLMAEAASLAGFRVLTIATKPSPTPIDASGDFAAELTNPSHEMNSSPDYQSLEPTSPNVLASPSEVTDRLTDPNSQPVVHIPLPGWVWNLDRRKEWHSALNQWKQIDKLVIFVELPPASVPEAVLLGSNLPNLVWLADGTVARAQETRAQLETLRHARCNLVGAVLNREEAKSVKRFFPRWMTCALLPVMMATWATTQVIAQELPSQLPLDPPPGDSAAGAPTNAPAIPSFSVVRPEQRAGWQNHLTLGPGDILTFALFGEPTLTRTEVVIAPDGRVSYLEAQDILATGLTVDELRSAIDSELVKFRRGAHSVITPIAYRSKKYFVLGKVVQRGVYVLDRPTTVLEALARARGLENGLLENDTIDLADLSRSFLMRDGHRMPVNFENLFQNGDLTQNIQIEPGDYLFFPSADVKQVYVVGEVGLPGLVTYRSDLTVLAAISYRGGFNEKAYKSKVLVIRGSLNHPETFAVDTMGMTAGRLPDFKLQPKDIVYVSHRPFYREEELLDLATTAFIQSVISSWVGDAIVKP